MSDHWQPGYPNPHTGGDHWFHGTRAYPEELSEHGFMDPMDMDLGGYENPDAETTNHWNTLLGTHFTADHKVAHEFAVGEHTSGENDRGDDPGRPAYQGVVHARLRLRNPKVYDSEHHMDHEAYEHEFAAGNHPSKHIPELGSDDEDDRYVAEDSFPNANRLYQEYGDQEIPRHAYTPHGEAGAGHPERTLWLSTHPDRHDIAQRFRDRLKAAGHDGIIYGNEYEMSQHGRQAVSAIAFHPHQAEIQQHHHAERECLDDAEADRQQARLPGQGQDMLPGLDHDDAYEHIRGADPLQHPVVQHFAAVQPDEEEDDRDVDDDEDERDECEYCGHDKNDHEGHGEAHYNWLTDQKWYTDWDEEGPGESLHRGIAMRLPHQLHDYVHDDSVPHADRAHALLRHVLHDQQQGSPHGGLGTSDDAWEHHDLPDAHPAALASLVEHFDEEPQYHPEASCAACGSRDYRRTEMPEHMRGRYPAPAECRNCGDVFDASVSGRERDEAREREHRDWERGVAEQEYHGETLYHGTRSELHPGEMLTPDEAERHPAHPDEESLGYVHATPSGEEAHGWGERASGFETHDRMSELGRTQPVRPGHNQGDSYRPRVYQVEPTGHVETDPNGEGTSYRTAQPMRVVREVHPLTCYHEDHEGAEHWPDHPHYEYLAQEQDEDEDDDWDEHEAALDDQGDEHDGDSYTICDQGHEHWGLNGAAGLLVRNYGEDGETRYLLQQRSPYVQHGRTWSTPGGAMGSGETPEHAALREAGEELGDLPGDLVHHHTHTDDHGGWAYHTVVMDAPHQFMPSGDAETEWESSGHGWFTPGEIKKLPLHPGFKSSWHTVQHSGALRTVAAEVPSFTHHYQAYDPAGGYIDKQREVTGPFYHGGRSKRLGEGSEITTGRKTNDWGDEGPKSQFVHFTTSLSGAAEYARQAGGHVYEVEPTGQVQMGYSGDEWKSKGSLKVRRVVPPEEVARHTGRLLVAANVADGVLIPRPVPVPALPTRESAMAAFGGWLPENATEMHALLDDMPGLFQALHEGLSAVARRLDDSPVSGKVAEIFRAMAASCLTAADDAADLASRPLDGPEGMWEGQRSPAAPKA